MIDKQQLQQLRKVDLYDFLLRHSPDEWHKEGLKYLKHKVHNSCIITKGKGFIWNSRHINGKNPIDFLQIFYGLSFKQAADIVSQKTIAIMNPNPSYYAVINKSIPVKANQPWHELYCYLCTERCLDKKIIDYLVMNNKLFCSYYGRFRNACFYDKDTRHYECVGLTKSRFKQVSDSQNFWYMGDNKSLAYVCESAIDAISLFQILGEDATYVSIAGSSSRGKLIEKVVASFDETVLAVDNDAAGDSVARTFKKLKRIVPINKDWNEDLIAAMR